MAILESILIQMTTCAQKFVFMYICAYMYRYVCSNVINDNEAVNLNVWEWEGARKGGWAGLKGGKEGAKVHNSIIIKNIQNKRRGNFCLFIHLCTVIQNIWRKIQQNYKGNNVKLKLVVLIFIYQILIDYYRKHNQITF